jgi:hypothetical protein
MCTPEICGKALRADRCSGQASGSAEYLDDIAVKIKVRREPMLWR